jgi:Tfp pilus assembly protein PilF
MSLTPGEAIGAYRIVEQLGSGGMATVYKAYHAALDRFVAIKVMHPAFKGDTNFMARFQREARVVAKLDHPNIVPVYDFSEHAGSPYLVMRFIEGETLKARLNQAQLPLPEILDVISPVGEALTYAHEQGVLHRDIKPSNVLLARDGRIFLTDFGLARIVQAGESSLTRDALVGTPYYISPEQAIGKSELDARTDIYSFGVVLYELFTGRVPFQSDTPFAVIHDHIYTPLPLPSSVNPNLPPALERVLLKALAKDPDDRHSTADELVAAIEEAVTGVAAIPPARSAVSPAPTTDETVGTLDKPVPEPAKTAITGPGVAGANDLASKTMRRVGKGQSWLWGLGIGLALLVIAAAVIFVLTRKDGKEAAIDAIEQPSVGEPAADELPPRQVPPDQEAIELIRSGSEMAASGDVEGALEAFQRAAELDPGAKPAYIQTARLFLQMGDIDPAIDTLRRGVGANPGDVDLHLYLAQALVGTERWEEAMMEIDWLIENAPELAEPHAYLSIHLSINVNDLDAARHHADEALRLDPDSPEAHFAMGVLHWKLKEYARARMELERAQRSDDVSPLLRERIQFFLERMEQPETNP